MIDQTILDPGCPIWVYPFQWMTSQRPSKGRPISRTRTGKFNANTYFKILNQNNLTPAQFEASQQREMLIQKIQGLLSESYLYTPSDVERYQAFLNRDLKANFISLSPAFYEKKVPANEGDLKDYYDSHRERYDLKEQAKARHILISVPSTASPADQAKAKQTLEDLRSQILSGKTTFSQAANKYSQDPAAKKGGELGWLDQGGTVKEFDDPFSLEKR